MIYLLKYLFIFQYTNLAGIRNFQKFVTNIVNSRNLKMSYLPTVENPLTVVSHLQKNKMNKAKIVLLSLDKNVMQSKIEFGNPFCSDIHK